MTRAALRRLAVVAVLAAAGALSCATRSPESSQTLPDRLSSSEFWSLSDELSEPSGYFRSENLVSNEHTFQYVIPSLAELVRPGGVYLGVAPDQNFTYIAATRPHMAFIVDIRRGNLLLQLIYKALFELSADRAEFVSRLFSKPRPPSLGPASGVADIFEAFSTAPTSVDLYQQNLEAMVQRLTMHHRFPLSADDLQQVESIYFSFYWEGPGIRYSMGPVGRGGRGFGRTSFPTFADLAQQTDGTGRQHGYLASEEHFRFVRGLELRNLVVPVVGNFAGPKALRAVGDWIRDRGSVVSAFYVSNVEQYLYQDGRFEAFAENVGTLPVDARSTFIRSVSARFGYQGPHQWRDGRATALYGIPQFNRDFRDGLLSSYYELNFRSR